MTDKRPPYCSTCKTSHWNFQAHAKPAQNPANPPTINVPEGYRLPIIRQRKVGRKILLD